MENFRVHDTLCFDESDRGKVYDLIATFMRYRGFVRKSASVDASLDCFQLLVREHVGSIVDEMFGAHTRAATRYWIVFFVGSPTILRMCDVFGVGRFGVLRLGVLCAVCCLMLVSVVC